MNEFIRQAGKATIDLPKKAQWIAEARALRAYCWLDAIDNYGGFPFADENNSVGSTAPEYRSREELFAYVENECKELLAGSDLYDYGQGEYGRANKGLVAMILAKLYLNAEVYAGKAMYAECAEVLGNLNGKYSLHTAVHGTGTNAYQELFLADNDKCTDELIFVIQQNGAQTASYGATNYLIFAATGDTMDPSAVGISSGWGGIRTTPEFYQMFDAADQRELFWEEGHTLSIDDISTFSNGMGFQKFKNIQSNGEPGSDKGFVDVDFPVFRYADALLMLAECELRGVNCGGKDAFDQVRARAGMPAYSGMSKEQLRERIRNERRIELCFEDHRFFDVRRWKLYDGVTPASEVSKPRYQQVYNLYSMQITVDGGTSYSVIPNSIRPIMTFITPRDYLFPIPDSEVKKAPNLKQNPGWEMTESSEEEETPAE
jgi:hypothetical protein